MSRINFGRVVLGGLLAGILINISEYLRYDVVMRGEFEAGMQALARLQLCFEADPKDLETLALLAQAFDVIGQSSKGVEVYKEMVRIAFETGQKELLGFFESGGFKSTPIRTLERKV